MDLKSIEPCQAFVCVPVKFNSEFLLVNNHLKDIQKFISFLQKTTYYQTQCQQQPITHWYKNEPLTITRGLTDFPISWPLLQFAQLIDARSYEKFMSPTHHNLLINLSTTLTCQLSGIRPNNSTASYSYTSYSPPASKVLSDNKLIGIQLSVD